MADGMKPVPGRPAVCPSLDALAAPAPGPEIQSHLDNCSQCRTDLALFKAFETDQPRPDELASVQWIENELQRRTRAATSTVPSPSAWSHLLAWVGAAFGPGRQRAFALAAASLLVVVATGLYVRHAGQVLPAGPPDGMVWRSSRFTAISPSGEITKTPVDLRWESVSGAASYQVQVLQVDRTILWSGETTQTAVKIPDNLRVQLTPGRAFQWQVFARNPAGEQIASTDLQNFHIVVTTP